jgi:hypothetical protein
MLDGRRLDFGEYLIIFVIDDNLSNEKQWYPSRRYYLRENGWELLKKVENVNQRIVSSVRN